MSFTRRSYRALAVSAGVCLLAACDITLTVPPLTPSASPMASATPPQSPSPTTEVPPNSSPRPSVKPSIQPSPSAGPSTQPSATVPPSQGGSPVPTPVPSAGQTGDLPGKVLEVIQLPLKSPYDVAVDPDGNMWITTPNETNALHKLGPDGTLIASYAGRGGVDVGVDAQGRIWTCSSDTHVLDHATGELLASYPLSSSHLAFDAAGAAWTTGYSDADLIKLGPNGVKAETFSLAPRDWNGGMAFDPDGNVWITGRQASYPESIQEILKVSPSGEVLARIPQHAMSIAFGSDKRAHTVLSNTVKTLDLDGKVVGSYAFGTDFVTFLDIAPDGKGNWLLLDSAGARIFRVTLE